MQYLHPPSPRTMLSYKAVAGMISHILVQKLFYSTLSRGRGGSLKWKKWIFRKSLTYFVPDCLKHIMNHNISKKDVFNANTSEVVRNIIRNTCIETWVIVMRHCRIRDVYPKWRRCQNREFTHILAFFRSNCT